jgi:hypothetical protein
MELRTEAAPTRRVLRGDDGAPLDGDRILAVALRWADRPLSVDHIKVGEERMPLEGVEIRWEGNLPLVAMPAGAKAWVERSPGNWVEPGRRTALELGETLIVQSGELTLEARIQRRSEHLPKSRRQESFFFGLVVAHSMMFFIAATVAMVFTPRVEEDSMWGSPNASKLRVSSFNSIPKSKPQVLEEKINEVMKIATQRAIVQQQPQQKTTAKDVLRLLIGGGGGLFGKGGDNALEVALGKVGGPNVAGEGVNGPTGKDMGGGIGGGGPFGIGDLPGGPRGPGPGGLRNGLRGKNLEDVICKGCTPKLPPGYDRDLVLKVVRRHQNEIRFCYESELPKSPDLAGKVTVAWTIGASGAVEMAEIADSGLANANVEACIVQKVRRWTFPEPKGGGEVAITFPWVFTVAGSDE